jgi:molybdopterin/thiamine biosynthesis adenylyltransferase
MKSLTNALENLKKQQTQANFVFKPLFYRLFVEKDLEAFEELLAKPGITVVDYIEDQIKELIKYKTPSKKFSTTELEVETKKYLGNTDINNYGVWVYYPWSNRLVHILDEQEFIDIRTSRNQYKITRKERDVLAQKKIGIIGLSVGQSVSVTLAMERICGELRLADFDVLELTNLNRIRTGIYNLGLPKVYSVAREIAEIDPFIKVTCFPRGLTEENMDQFFTANGKLDLLVEESDGFDIKILSRYKARELQVPVIMEASDRCMVDVERFDLEPNRKILHGLVEHLDIETLKSLKTNEQKIPYMLAILGLETSSTRLKASMLEIEQSINTWPQLASSVTMGGGITADVSRRILLNQYTDSGRYHIDIEELIGNKVKPKVEELKLNQPILVDFKKLSERVTINQSPNQLGLLREEVEEIVSCGCKAPSGGNSQPWRWVYKDRTLLLFIGFDGNSTLLGYNNISSFVAIGSALENVCLCAKELNFEVAHELFPDKNVPELIVAFRFFKVSISTNQSNASRFKAIDLRLTNRNLGQRLPIEEELLKTLISTAQETDGVQLRFFSSDEELNAIGDLLGELEKIRLLEEMGHNDFVEEIRWTKEENEEKRDGVDLRTLDITASELIGLQIAKDQKIIKLINEWDGGGAFKKLTRKSIDAAGAVGIITIQKKTKEAYVNAGISLQRIWLESNMNGIAFQPMSASVFVYARLMDGGGVNISRGGCEKLSNLRPLFEKTFSIPKHATEIFIFRLSKASEPAVKSLRKPLKEIFYYF